MANKSRKISNKKNTKKVETKTSSIVSGNELKNLIKIILIICGVLLAFYFITVLVQDKNKKSNDTSDTVAVIQYDKILVGEILNRIDSEYYVLVEQENDAYIDLYKQYPNNKTYYTVDLSDVFNQNHIANETTVEGNEVGNYKFSNTTLIKVANNSVEAVYKTKDEIIEYLKTL